MYQQVNDYVSANISYDQLECYVLGLRRHVMITSMFVVATIDQTRYLMCQTKQKG